MRINCTVVELKLRMTNYVYFCYTCINCTVVELKQNFVHRMIGRQRVLIVPLWN